MSWHDMIVLAAVRDLRDPRSRPGTVVGQSAAGWRAQAAVALPATVTPHGATAALSCVGCGFNAS